MNAITIEGVLVEQVPGAPWLVAHKPGGDQVAIAPVRPAYISEELRDAWTAHLVASVLLRCPWCDAVAETPPAMKTAVADGRGFIGDRGMRHDPACRASEENIGDLERRDSLTGTPELADMSDEATDPLIDYLRKLMGQA